MTAMPPLQTRDPLDAVELPDGSTLAQADPAVAGLYRAALARRSIGPADVFTARDLLVLADAPLADPARHALLLALFAALREGSLCLRLAPDRLADRLRTWIGPAGAAQADAIVAGASGTDWAELIADAAAPDDADRALVRLDVAGAPVVYFRRWYATADALGTALAERLDNAADAPGALPLDRAQALTAAALAVPGAALRWTARQALALLLAAHRNTLLLSGGPGTGKTTVLRALVELFRRMDLPPETVRLAAPTGRAAERMAEALRSAPSADGSNPAPAAYAAAIAPCTLHRLFAYSPSRHAFGRTRRRPLEARAVVVDEASMIDAALMLHLLRATPPDAKLILLGDRDQLPSVDAGAVLADLTPPADACRYGAETLAALAALLDRPLADADPGAGTDAGGTDTDSAADRPVPPERLADTAVVFTENHRSGPAIRAFADAIRRAPTAADPDAEAAVASCLDALPLLPADPVLAGGDGPAAPVLAPADPADGVWRVDPSLLERDGWAALLAAWAHRWFVAPLPGGSTLAALLDRVRTHPAAGVDGASEVLGQVLDAANAARILTAERRGPRGCETINDRLAACLRGPLGNRRRGRTFPGMPVVVTRNDHARRLYNGETGVIAAFADTDRDRVVFRRAGGLVVHPVDALADRLAPAFATTIHKSQGSAFDSVLVVLPAAGTVEDGPPAADADAAAEPPRHLLLTREILYTAVTRARRHALLAAEPAALSTAILHPVRRESGLRIEPAAKTHPPGGGDTEPAG